MEDRMDRDQEGDETRLHTIHGPVLSVQPETMEDLEDLEGVRVGGENINKIRYAYDTVLIAYSEEKIQ